MAQTAEITAVGEAAAAVDPEVTVYRDSAHEAARGEARALAAELKRRGVLAPHITEADAAEAIYALAADEGVYLRLTRECGWSDGRYAELLGRILQAAIGSAPSA